MNKINPGKLFSLKGSLAASAAKIGEPTTPTLL